MNLDAKVLPKEGYVTRAGSYAYGLNTPESDEDFRGFFFPQPKNVLGYIDGPEHRQIMDGGLDFTLWEVRKFFRLAAQANPNVIEQLFADPVDHIYVSPLAKEILANRKLFLSRRIAKTYLGYATGNFKRIRTGDDDHDYDGKDAMHMIRLLKTGFEAIMTGELRVKRSDDRDMLLSIKRRELTFQELNTGFQGYMAQFDKYEDQSPLPVEPDHEALNDLLGRLMLRYIKEETA